MRILEAAAWHPLAEAHARRAGELADPFARRRSRGEKHPVEDFLFTYYALSPGQLKRWHPGAGVILLDAPEHLGWKHYRPATASELEAAGVSPERAADVARAGTAATVDVAGFLRRRRRTVDFVRDLLSRTAARPGSFGCFGLHEWAMAYRSELNGHRHEYLGLRLGAGGTDEVVESHRIVCTHFDAFRFFQPQAVERNQLQPTRQTQREMEQPGCLHANMDVYKWAYKLLPLVDSALVLDAFELARRIREMDMRAAPYDLADWGYAPIRIETAEGKREYARMQRGHAGESQELRRRLLDQLDAADPDAAPAARREPETPEGVSPAAADPGPGAGAAAARGR